MRFAQSRRPGLEKGLKHGSASPDLLHRVPDPDPPHEQADHLIGERDDVNEGRNDIVGGLEEQLEAQETRARPPPPARQDLHGGLDPVALYLKNIGRVPLITPAEEVDLSMRIEGGHLAGGLLATLEKTNELDRDRFGGVVARVNQIRENQLDPSKSLQRVGIGLEETKRGYSPSRSESAEFLGRVSADGRAAKTKMVEANLRLVVSIAKRYVSQRIMFLDLVQEGNLGLIRAVEKFDHRRGFRFSTYATWWIRQYISRAIAEQSRTIRIPTNVSDELNKVDRAERDLTQHLGREPVAQEIGDHLGMSPARIGEIVEASKAPLSIETPVGGTDQLRLGDTIRDEDAIVPLEAASAILLKAALESVLGTVSQREKRVIQLRFGLLDGHPHTLEDVGREFGLTRERIRQIEAKAISKLRHPSRAQRLRDYFE